MTEGAESEINVFTAAGFDKKVREAQNQVADGFTVLQQQDNNFHAAMLLIAKIEQTGVVWERPVIVFKLYRQNEWIDLSPGAGRPPSAGKVSVSSKPSQSQVWNSMEWLPLDGGCQEQSWIRFAFPGEVRTIEWESRPTLTHLQQDFGQSRSP